MKDRKLASRYARALLESIPNKDAEEVDRFLGGLGAALEESQKFVKNAYMLGRPIRRYQVIENSITDMKRKLQAARNHTAGAGRRQSRS